jgi:hypothetical protein
MLALSGRPIASITMVTMITHALGVVLRRRVRTLGYASGLSSVGFLDRDAWRRFFLFWDRWRFRQLNGHLFDINILSFCYSSITFVVRSLLIVVYLVVFLVGLKLVRIERGNQVHVRHKAVSRNMIAIYHLERRIGTRERQGNQNLRLVICCNG